MLYSHCLVMLWCVLMGQNIYNPAALQLVYNPSSTLTTTTTVHYISQTLLKKQYVYSEIIILCGGHVILTHDAIVKGTIDITNPGMLPVHFTFMSDLYLLHIPFSRMKKKSAILVISTTSLQNIA